MSKDIRFRAWNKNLGDWHNFEGNSVQLPYVIGSGKIAGFRVEQQDLSFTQSTGLKDKNGVEIYEGDIAMPTDYYRNCPIIFDQHYARFAFEADEDDESLPLNKYICSKEIEIIGNIYESPNLVEREDAIE